MTYPPTAQRPVRTWDAVLSVVLYSVAALLGALAAYITVFFVMAAGACSTESTCDEGLIVIAMILSWGGTALAILGIPLALLIAALKRWTMWWWGALANVLVIATFFGGVALVYHAAG
ncbi:hypothetical protein IU433_29960 [Nocardia puris]|uniref:Uncharacterized protein n=1 Tax=Nocardia puris TaxID=208602 RepID=A0A366DJK8_9NOCA|nr:hypothetical protein [Nocardia puris]MBF6212889.1 hypothetical protein [Nocardia puris]MBF6367880.1 hypothetical protein [Nocardia puris]MBF6463229.1 hypothetical protein [Nocardia puris]RBO90135.1 hypothetical protein DFR74_10619 [Nocardia puris]